MYHLNFIHNYLNAVSSVTMTANGSQLYADRILTTELPTKNRTRLPLSCLTGTNPTCIIGDVMESAFISLLSR